MGLKRKKRWIDRQIGDIKEGERERQRERQREREREMKREKERISYKTMMFR